MNRSLYYSPLLISAVLIVAAIMLHDVVVPVQASTLMTPDSDIVPVKEAVDRDFQDFRSYARYWSLPTTHFCLERHC